MNVGIYLGHPAQFHYYKHVATELQADGHQVFFAVKEKDILEDLLRNANIPYTKVRGKRGDSKLAMIWSLIKMDWNVVRFVRKNKIDLLFGVPPVWGTRLLCHKPVLLSGEDDAHVAPRSAKLLYTVASELITPISCDNGKWNAKSIKYPGYLKLAYLHPKRFTPNPEIVAKYGIGVNGDASLNGGNGGNPFEPYFLLRFAKLNAHHDNGVSGISTEIAEKVVSLLEPHGKIFITSERELEPQFEKYRLKINPLDIHHVMAYATLYIGDSQSMAVEAAMLGVPGVRFNDFVGKKKIGVMEELEKVYGVTYGISSHKPETLYAKIDELLAMPNVREVFQKRRAKMLSEKIDVTAFFTWMIENYPESAKEARNAADDFWNKFK